MRHVPAGSLVVLALLATGCDSRAPRQAIPARGVDPGANANAESEASAGSVVIVSRPKTRPKKKFVYQGRTAEQWGAALLAREEDEVWRASLALRIMGTEGRPYLIKGLQNSSPHTRRICLETLSVCDFRCYGEDGRRLLVELAGDDADVRIRERAALYLAQWNRAIPAP
jgi:hypothetical protein